MKNGLIFLLAFIVAFGGGYLFFTKGDASDSGTTKDSESTTETVVDDEKEVEEQASVEYEPLSNNSCLSCHAVSSLGIEGGTTGPDLSDAYSGIEGKHGVDLDSFLQEPTSAVMSGVIEGSPLSDEDRADIIEILKEASEK